MMQRLPALFLAFLIGGHPGAPSNCAGPCWSKNLKESDGFRNFDQQGDRPWQSQQGIRFIAADRLAVYQVEEQQQQGPLQPRDASGGAGRFHLRIAFLQASDGRELKTLAVQTNAYVADILPTHDGQFLIHAGQALYLYSASFEPLRLRRLPFAKVAREESWDVGVSPAGTNVFLAHHQIFGRKEGSRTDVEVLDADTLEHVVDVPVQHLNDFSAGDGFLLTQSAQSEPALYSGWGIVDLQGQRTQIAAVVAGNCPPFLRALAHQLVADVGCNMLSVKSLSNREVFSKTLKGRDTFISVANSGHFLAAEVSREKLTAWLDLGNPWKPLRIELYDLSKPVEMHSVEIKGNEVQYAVSARGDLAVVEGDLLTLHNSLE
jgi:hypothetical protein